MINFFYRLIRTYKNWINRDSFEKAIKLDQLKVYVHHESAKRRYTDTLLISCVDFRFRSAIEDLMCEVLHLTDNYDEVVLPGASLSLVEKIYPDWERTLEEVIEVLQKLHHIKQIIFLDHRDCSAYKLIKGEKSVSTKACETKTHAEVFKEVRKIMHKKFPELKIYTLLIGLDGVVDNIKG